MPFLYSGSGYPDSLFASQSLAFTLNIAEETVSFTIDTSGEEERIGWPCGLSIAKDQCPQTINRDDQAFLVFQLTKQSSRVRIKHIDMPIAKVPYQQVITELAKIGGSESQAPGRIQCPTRNEACLKLPVRIEDIDKAATGTRRIIVMRRILQCERNVEVAPDVLDAERRKTLVWQRTRMRQLRVGEGTNQVKVCIELLYFTEAEIGRVDKFMLPALTKSKSFVDGTCPHTRAIYCEDSIGQIDTRIPTRNGAVFSIKHEETRTGFTVL